MQAEFQQIEFRLDSRDMLSLRRAAAAAITVVKGSIWVTQDGKARDHVLLCGQTLRVDGDAALLLAALSPAQVSVAAPRPRRGLPARLARGLVATYLRLVRRARGNAIARRPLAALL